MDDPDILLRAAVRLRAREASGADVSEIAFDEEGRRWVEEDCGGDPQLARLAFAVILPEGEVLRSGARQAEFEDMPDRVYAVGDEVRLRVEVSTTENPTYVTATFCAEDAEDVTFTLHGDLQLEGLSEASPRRVSTKTYGATLVSLVDVDHRPGNYRLAYLTYHDPAVVHSQTRGRLALANNWGR